MPAGSNAHCTGSLKALPQDGADRRASVSPVACAYMHCTWLDLRVQMPMILMGATAMRGFMQQRDTRSLATIISTAVKHVQEVA